MPRPTASWGGIMKLYRDWQISGDTAWLKCLYPLARRSLDFCISLWDPHRKGGLFEPHHNTYDIEFWGPDGMCGSIYVGALSAMAEMAKALNQPSDHETYSELASRAAQFLDSQLFNGEYYQQHVQWEGLRDTSFVESLSSGTIDADTLALYQAEGPKYQYGKGCLSDGIIGGWMANTYGIDTPLDREHVRATLASIFRYKLQAGSVRPRLHTTAWLRARTRSGSARLHLAAGREAVPSRSSTAMRSGPGSSTRSRLT